MSLQYDREVAKFSKKDAIIALAFFAYFMRRQFAIHIAYLQFDISEDAWRTFIYVIAIVDILITFAIVKIRKQSLASIGLHKKNIWKAAGIGFLFAPIFMLHRIVPGLFWGAELHSFGQFMLILVSVALRAIREDINFVGFIQTRLHGIVKNDFWAINLGALLFTLVHIPSRLIHGYIEDINFVLLLINWFFMHRAFVLLFKRYFSLIPVFIMHIASNFPRLWLGDERVAWWWGLIATVAFCVAVEIWYTRWNESIADKADKGENIYDKVK